jgi:hypothetical protein
MLKKLLDNYYDKIDGLIEVIHHTNYLLIDASQGVGTWLHSASCH